MMLKSAGSVILRSPRPAGRGHLDRLERPQELPALRKEASCPPDELTLLC
jgi:hypothetical protein